MTRTAAKIAALWLAVNVTVGVYVGVAAAWQTPAGEHALALLRQWVGLN